MGGKQVSCLTTIAPSSILGNSAGNFSSIQIRILSLLPVSDLVSARASCQGLSIVGKEHRDAIISRFSTLTFTDMAIVLGRLKEMMLKNVMHPSRVVTRAPTAQEISELSGKNILANPCLFQASVCGCANIFVQHTHVSEF